MAALEFLAKTLPKTETKELPPVFSSAEPEPPQETIPLPRSRPVVQNMGPMDLQFAKQFADAGHEAGQRFSAALNSELQNAENLVSSWSNRMKGLLGFKSSPKVTPIIDTPSVSKGPRHVGPGWLSSSKRRGSHSDAMPVPVE